VQIDEKKKIVENLREIFSKSKVLIVTDYKGLNVITINELRRKLREADVEYKVAKNSLLVRASEDTDVSLIAENFKGPIAIAISYDDPVAPAKVLMQFCNQGPVRASISRSTAGQASFSIKRGPDFSCCSS